MIVLPIAFNRVLLGAVLKPTNFRNLVNPVPTYCLQNSGQVSLLKFIPERNKY